jgi:hypothetical protein
MAGAVVAPLLTTSVDTRGSNTNLEHVWWKWWMACAGFWGVEQRGSSIARLAHHHRTPTPVDAFSSPSLLNHSPQQLHVHVHSTATAACIVPLPFS